MPDIEMCTNHECPLKETRYRYKAKPSEYAQSYALYMPTRVFLDQEELAPVCQHHLPIHNQ